MHELVSYIAASLVDHPEAVTIDSREEDDALMIELRVAHEDLGKIIGKQGRTARAIRGVLTAAAARQGKRVKLEIVE